MSKSSRPVWLGEDLRRWDHMRVHVQVLHDERLTPRPAGSDGRTGPSRSHVIAVYLGLVAHGDLGTGMARPSRETLAGYAGCSTKTVDRVLDALVDAGYVNIESHPGAASRYFLLPPPTLDLGSQVSSADPGPGVVTSLDQGSATLDLGSHEQELEQEPLNEAALAVAPGLSWIVPAIVQNSGFLDDAVALCERFAAELRDREGVRVDPRAKAWVVPMELLLRKDGNTTESVARTLEWLARGADGVSHWWQPVVLSPDALRRNWVKMRAQYNRDAAPKPSKQAVALGARAGPSLGDVLNGRNRSAIEGRVTDGNP